MRAAAGRGGRVARGSSVLVERASSGPDGSAPSSSASRSRSSSNARSASATLPCAREHLDQRGARQDSRNGAASTAARAATPAGVELVAAEARVPTPGRQLERLDAQLGQLGAALVDPRRPRRPGAARPRRSPARAGRPRRGAPVALSGRTARASSSAARSSSQSTTRRRAGERELAGDPRASRARAPCAGARGRREQLVGPRRRGPPARPRRDELVAAHRPVAVETRNAKSSRDWRRRNASSRDSPATARAAPAEMHARLGPGHTAHPARTGRSEEVPGTMGSPLLGRCLAPRRAAARRTSPREVGQRTDRPCQRGGDRRDDLRLVAAAGGVRRGTTSIAPRSCGSRSARSTAAAASVAGEARSSPRSMLSQNSAARAAASGQCAETSSWRSSGRCSLTARRAQSRTDHPATSGNRATDRPASSAVVTGSVAAHCTARSRARHGGEPTGRRTRSPNRDHLGSPPRRRPRGGPPSEGRRRGRAARPAASSRRGRTSPRGG